MSIFIKAGLWTEKIKGFKGELNLSQLFSGGGSNSYSQAETFTGGTWIDGKPIYRKVIPFTVPSQISPPISLDIDHNLGIDTYISLWITTPSPPTSQDSLFTFPVGAYGNNIAVNTTGAISTSENTFRFEEVVSGNAFTNDFYLVIEYTKV